MKKVISFISLCFAFALSCFGSPSDFDFKYDNKLGGYVVYCTNKEIETADIPSKINGINVVAIGSEAFYGCYNLSEIIIPESIRKIELGAFNSCWSLTSVTIPKGVKEIGNSAFR